MGLSCFLVNQGAWKLGISVLEVTTIEPVLEQAENILTEMRMFKYEKGWQYDDDYNRTVNIRSERLDFFFVFVVDVVAQKGYLLGSIPKLTVAGSHSSLHTNRYRVFGSLWRA